MATIPPPRILVAGIGNVFLGDDAFGVEVVRSLSERPRRAGVEVVDFGIRGFDLACALLDGYDAAIFVDAVSRGGEPGTLHIIEPHVDRMPQQDVGVQGHALTPDQVLNWALSFGGHLPRLLLLGCEPASFGSEDKPQMGLSPPVAASLAPAIRMLESLINEISLEASDPVRRFFIS